MHINDATRKLHLSSISGANTMLYAAILCFVFLLVLRRGSLRMHARLQMSLPPSPPGHFIIGHVLKVKSAFPWKTFASWTKTFGNVIYVHIFGKPMIILNSYETAKELLDRRGAIYIDRPRLVLIQELMGLDFTLTFMRYGERFTSLRRMIRQPFNPSRIASFFPVHRRETHILLRNILQEPNKFEKHIERAVAGSIMMSAYGHQIESDEDEFTRLAKETTELIVESGSAGASLVDAIPILRFIPSWLPGAGFKRHALKTQQLQKEATMRPFEMVQDRRTMGKSMPCFVDLVLDAHEQNGDIDPMYVRDARDAASVLYMAAVETTITILRAFILAMITHLDVAKKAHEEIDTVIGNDRLPDFNDRQNLPYINCILKETYRWNPPLPLGIPHRSLDTDFYEGMRIPRGSTVVANIWAMMMDKNLYDEPEKYLPDRFHDKCSNTNTQNSGYTEFDPESKVFGFGRRICPGRFYADSSLWLMIACLIAAFDILPAVDDEGNVKIPAIEFTSGLGSQPAPFDCRFVIRKQSYASLITQHAGKSIADVDP